MGCGLWGGESLNEPWLKAPLAVDGALDLEPRKKPGPG